MVASEKGCVHLTRVPELDHAVIAAGDEMIRSVGIVVYSSDTWPMRMVQHNSSPTRERNSSLLGHIHSYNWVSMLVWAVG